MERPVLPHAIDGTQQRLDVVIDILLAQHAELVALRQPREPSPASSPVDDPAALLPLREGPRATAPAPRVPSRRGGKR